VTFSGVAAGAYILQALKSGYVTGTGSVAVGSSVTVSITLQTQPSGGRVGGGVPGFPVDCAEDNCRYGCAIHA
jgi:hypothetical protein